MKRVIMTIILLTIFLRLFAPGFNNFYIIRQEGFNPVLALWEAVKIVESANNHSVINYKEGAYGCGQIRQIKIDDYNKLTRSHVLLSDCLNESISKKIFVWHCSRYNDIETAAKRWNGSGPAVEVYWIKIKKHLI